jgi:predicted nucleic acid-binding protein
MDSAGARWRAAPSTSSAVGLCRSSEARGSVVPDAYLAALAIERGATMSTADRGFARFDGLRWRHPYDDAVTPEPPG